MKQVLGFLKGKGYNIEPIERDEYTDLGLYASIYYVNEKIVRIVSDSTGVGAVPINVEQEFRIYEKMIGDTNDHLVHIHLAKYFAEEKSSVVVMEKLDKSWEDLDPEFNDLFDLMFDKHGIHNKLSYVPNENQMDLLINKATNEDWEIRTYSALADDEKRLLMDVFKGTTELRQKYLHTVNDLHIGNVMRDPNAGNYKLIDVGI